MSIRWKYFQEEPSYANSNILQVPQQERRVEPDKRWQNVEPFDSRRPLRAQSVQPVQEHLTGKANFQAKRFSSNIKSPRSER